MSLKKSSILMLAIFAVITLVYVFMNGSNSMQVSLGDDSVSFSGIGDFSLSVSYSDIESAELTEISDWNELHGSYESGTLRCGKCESDAFGSCTIFVSTQAKNAVVLTLSDGEKVVFNYNSTSSTAAFYEMLQQNLK